MAKQRINIGSAANDSTGDPLRTAFTKINQNFDEVYANVASSNYRFSNNTMSTVTGDMNIVPNGTSDVIIGSLNQLNVSATTSSVSTTTGALVVKGGAGIGGALWVGDDITTAGTLYAGTASFGSIDDTPIGATIPSSGDFTTATIADLTVTDSIDFQGEANFVNLNVSFNAVTSNFQSGNVNITGGTLDSVIITGSTVYDVTLADIGEVTGVVFNDCLIGNTTPRDATFTKMTTANAQITGGNISGVNLSISSLNNTPIGNAIPSTGVFTSVTGYHTGAIGANTPNSGVFTSVSTTSGGEINGYLTGPIGANVANTAVFTDIQSDTGFIDTCYFTNMVANSSSYFRLDVYAQTLNASTIGNTGANIYGTHNGPVFGPFNGTIGDIGPNTGSFSTLTAYSGYNGSTTGAHNGVIGGVTPNVGTFTNLTVNGTLSVTNNDIIGNVTGNVTGYLIGSASSATTAGTATYASTAGLASTATTVVQPYQGNITGVGTLANITTTGNLVCANVYVNSNLFAYQDINVIGNINFLNTSGYLNLQRPWDMPNRTVTSGVGLVGDIKGQMCWDTGNIYVCTADYDGVSVIWKRTALTSI